MTPDQASTEPNWDALRTRMVDQQIARRGVRDPRVLAAMRSVPRHRFVPDEMRAAAYEDRPLPIGQGQTISQPYIVAVMTAALDVGPSHDVLEIGTGCGYQTAVLASLARCVVSIERLPELAARATTVLDDLGITNVQVVVGDGSLGCGAPGATDFDRILVTAGAPSVPPPLLRQLRPGGVLVIPVGSRSSQTLQVVRREADGLRTTELDACAFVPLVGGEAWGS